MTTARRTERRRMGETSMPLDVGLLALVLALIGLGIIMVASASMPLAEKDYHDPLHYVARHLFALGVALGAAIAAYWVPMAWWQRGGWLLLLLGFGLLILVLVPGVGHEVNGATRWIPLGPFYLQTSELVKLFVIIYLAGYLVRHRETVIGSVWGLVRPMILIGLIGALIMLQPDFGTTAVIMATALGLLFLGGVRLRPFLLLLAAVGMVLAVLIAVEPYRFARILAFLHPFEDPYGANYQAVQALIAFGRGEWLGVGLGNGIQKQFFLPEPHTDFIAAMIGEELGLVGVLAVIAAFTLIVWRAFEIGARAAGQDAPFNAYLAYGVGLSIGLQAFVNLGVNLVILPTKGLTLPFVSYGNNSLLVACIAIGLLLRIDSGLRRRTHETEPRKGLRWVRA